MSSPVLWYATRTLGVMALLLLTASMVLGMMTSSRFMTARWPRVAQQDIHRRLSLLSVLFLIGHILTSVLDSYVHIGWTAVVVPFASDYKRLWVGFGTIGLDLLLAISLTSVLRHRVPARAWRTIHWLAYLSWPIAVVHAIGIGTDMRLHWVLAMTLVCVAAVAAVGVITGRQRIGIRRRAAVLPAIRDRVSGIPIKHRATQPVSSTHRQLTERSSR